MIDLDAGRIRRGGDALGVLDMLLDIGARSHARAGALLLALSLAVFLPGLVSLQPMDRDEPRFAQASKQMLETGDLVDIRFQAEARHKKPVGIYWAQAAAVAAGEAMGVAQARTTIALYRIPSLVGALAAVLLSYWAGLAVLTRRGALLASALFGTCLMLSAEAHLAKTDALLAACTTAAMGGLARAWIWRGRRDLGHAAILAFWVAMALGILVKGPMVPLFVGLPALVLSWRDGSGRWLLALRPALGLGITLSVVAPWFLAIAWKSGGAFFGASVGQDMLAKVGGAAEKHGAPPGTYLLVFFATFWPAAPFAALGLPRALANRRADAAAFLLAWIVPAWLLFEAVPTKLPHYLLPLVPAVAILAVAALVPAAALEPWQRGTPPGRLRQALAAILVVLIPAGILAGLVGTAWHLDRVVPWAGLPLMTAACLVALLSALALMRETAERALILAVAASVLLLPGVLGLTQPAIASLKVSPRLAAIRDGLPCRPKVASLGYREPSLVFLIGTDLTMLNTGAEARDFLNAGGCRLVFVEDRYGPEFEATKVQAKIVGQVIVGQVSGFNLNSGRRVDLSAYGVVPR
ncbi:MAG: glycosyltransferase family 39 protein [Methylobacterium sp.]|uniref:ArnT family glycosyltransferase n=1 Tax=Methylobacterium sp. TaxID=409 RepID=UPI0025F7606D|nr:phospholipid carrier-dependent glycosyltransferase [Methylobacterium sp.]MBX9934902.1 glycosyltransferase family 39 protein [Methylobacterium sp.]